VDERLYRLPHGQEYFEAGTAAGKQVLLGNTVHHVVLHWFDSEGRFVEVWRFQMAVDPEKYPGKSIYRTDAAYWQQVKSEIETIKARIGFVPADILVRKFESEEASIEDLPGTFADFLRSPHAYDEADRKSLEDAIRYWHEQGCFVLSWGEDYWLSGSGEVISC
jgi:hypothetical protein